MADVATQSVDPFAAAGWQAVPDPQPSAKGAPPTHLAVPSDNQGVTSDPFAAAGWQPVPDPTKVQSQQEPQSTWRGIGRNLAAVGPEVGAAALNVARDPFGTLIGRPALTLGGFLYDAGAHATGLYSPMTPEQRASLSGVDEPEQAGTTAVNAVGKAIGAPTPEEVPANGPAERLIRKAGTAAGTVAALGPGGVVPSLIGAGGAVVGDQAAAAAPDWAKPGVELLGNVAGGAATGEAANVATKVGRGVANQAGQMGFSSPKILGGEGPQTIGGVKASPTQVQAAGKQVTSALGDQGVQNLQGAARAQALTDALNDPAVTPADKARIQAELSTLPPPEQVVPGSQPTTAQVAMTPGAATLEKAHRTATPDPFLARQTEQNSARLASVQGLAPESAQPASVGQFFQQQLNALDQQGQQAVQQARTGVQQAVEGAGQSLQQQAANLDRAGQQAVQQAGAGVQRATGALGGTQTTGAYGDQARAALQAARDPVHAQTQALWDAVDPDGTWALPVGQARETAGQLSAEISPTAQTDAQETALLQRASQMPDVVKFGDLTAMRADTNAAMRRLSGTPGYEPNVRRLTLLKQSIDNSISDAIDGRVAQEAQAVAAGQMAPEQTLEANLQRQQQDWYAARNAQARAGGDTGTNAGPNAGMGQTALSGASRAEGQARGGSRNIAGNQGLQGQEQPLEPNLTQEHADAYRAAVNATRGEKQRFGQGGVGQVLRPGKNGEEFAVQSGTVPRKIFTGGPTEPQEVQRFIAAVGGADRAAQIGRETLANDLRQSGIIRSDGTLDPNRFARWQAQHQATIQQFPGLGEQFANAARAQETLDNVTQTHSVAQDARNTIINEFRQGNIIDPDGTINADRFARWRARRSDTIRQFPGLGDQFANAETAQRTLDDAMATHKAALDDFQKSAAAKFINNDPAKAVQQAFSSGNPTATFTQLVRQVRGNADAEAGLKRAVVDYITEKTRSATPANSTEDFQKAATFRNFIRQNNGALKALFGGQGVQNLDMVAADLRRQAQQTTATAGSDTAANIAKAHKIGLKEGGFHGTALAVIGEQLGEMLAHVTGQEGVLGAAVGAGLGGGGYLLHAMRQSGIATINDLVREAMLHPQLARELVAKTQGKLTPTLAHRIARAIQATVLAQPAQQEKQ